MLFDEIMKKMGNELLGSLSESKDRRKTKTIQTRYGKIQIDKISEVCQQLSSEKTSPFLNEKLMHIGNIECYKRGSQMTEMLFEF